jgi:hypothetical protein
MEAQQKTSERTAQSLAAYSVAQGVLVFQGDKRAWNNEFRGIFNGYAIGRGVRRNDLFDRAGLYSFFPTFRRSLQLAARTIEPPKGFLRTLSTGAARLDRKRSHRKPHAAGDIARRPFRRRTVYTHGSPLLEQERSKAAQRAVVLAKAASAAPRLSFKIAVTATAARRADT